MNKTLIWMVKSSLVTPTKKNFEELLSKSDLYDASTVDKTSKEYLKAEREIRKAAKLGYSILTYPDSHYPACLREISNPPAILYVRGNISVLNGIVYAGIVGSRKCDNYGIQMASNIAREVGYTGAGVVSGGATGVDAAAHDGALRAKAPTVAVLGCGVDVNYPQPNKELFERIVESGGAIISEFPLGTRPWSNNFPKRNRIIAAMSTAVVLARAGRRSGGLITVNQAMSMNKTVFAVPGNIDSPLSIGANELIRDGALPLLNPMDLIDELIVKNPDYFIREKEKPQFETQVPQVPDETVTKTEVKTVLSEYEREVVSIIENGFTTQNLIEEKISFDPTRLTALLGMMEIKGIIKKKADKSYIIIGGKC